jgi:ribosomal protein S14
MNNYNIIFLKEKKKRFFFLKNELPLLLKKYLFKNEKILFLKKIFFFKKNINIKKITSHCAMTRRYKTIFKAFNLSRHTLRTQIDRSYLCIHKKK